MLTDYLDSKQSHLKDIGIGAKKHEAGAADIGTEIVEIGFVEIE